MNTYKIIGYSYEAGHYVLCGNVEAKSERAALLKARKAFDQAGFGYEHFLAQEVAA